MRVKRSLSVTAATALVLAVGLLSSAQTIDNSSSKIRIENFGCINENLYRGAEPSLRDLENLKEIGVKTIIDLQREGRSDEQRQAESLGLKFYRIGMSTTSKPSPQQIEEFLKIVDDPANQPVFMHCHGGRHRTGLMSAVYRMTHENWTADRAYVEMKQYQFEKGFGHGALKRYVYDYYTQLEPSVSGQQTTKAAVSSR